MGVHIDLKVEGMEDVLKALRQAADKDLTEAVFKVGRRYSKEVFDEAVSLCPVDNREYEGAPPKYPPGNLSEAIKKRNSRKKLSFQVYVRDKGAFYGPFVEYGHKTADGGDVPGVAFLRRPWRKRIAGFDRDVVAALMKVVKAVDKK